MSHDKSETTPEHMGFCLFGIDQQGWLKTYDSLEEAEGSLEWIDVRADEYLLIDNDASLYAAMESSSGYYGYRLKKTKKTRPDVLSVLQLYSDDQRLTNEHLAMLRHASS